MSFVFQINGVDMPSPTVFNPEYEDLHTNTGTNAQGHVRFNTIRRNRAKLNVEFSFLTRAEFALIINAIKNIDFFNVTYYDPTDNAVVTKKFYKGNRTIEFFNHWVGMDAPRHLKVNFIEG